VHHRLVGRGAIERIVDGDSVEYVALNTKGRGCLKIPRHDRYTVYRLRSRRGPHVRPAMEVHFRGGAHPRVLGIVRVAP
jgi:hypothetical protein